jgi:stage III sporulation protein AF
MALLTEWISHIVIFMLLAMIVDMLLPDSGMRKYVKLVTGFLFIAVVITPVFKLFSTDAEALFSSFPVQGELSEKYLEEKTEEKKKEIETSKHAYILKQMAVQMKESAEKEMMDRYGMIITDISIKSEPGQEDIAENIQKITVVLAPAEKTKEIEKVKEVMVDLGQEPSGRASRPADDIITMLSQHWDIPAEKIEVTGEGRNL